jgi:hypothetical protein
LGVDREAFTLGGVMLPRRGEDEAIEAAEDAPPYALDAREKSWF